MKFVFSQRGEASLELANFSYSATLTDPPIAINSPGYYVCEFWVSEIDTTPPTIQIVEDGREWNNDTLLVGSSGHSCLAQVAVPYILAEDECHDVKMVKVMTTHAGSYQLVRQPDGSWKCPDIIQFPMHDEPYQVIYEALDACHQLGRDTIYLRVKDLTDPLAVSNKMLNLSLTGKKVWVDAVNFDEGSWDNCSIQTLLARRTDWLEACIDLCSDFDFASGDFYQNYFNHFDTLGEVGSYYANTLKWLSLDPSDCNELILNGWLYDLHRYTSIQCQGESQGAFDHEIATLLGDQSVLDAAKLLGGGWSNAVPFTCEDICDTVTVELMVMDYWCNWNKTWTKVWVEDKTPISVGRELETEIEISCYSYHDPKYAINNQAASLSEIVELAHAGQSKALQVLDETFGTYQKAWLDGHGKFVDAEGVEIDSEVEFPNKQCECRDTSALVAILDNHGQTAYKDSTWRICDYYNENLTFQQGILLVNCPDLFECRQEVWSDLDQCGIGTIYRKFTVIAGCSGHNPIPIEFTQTIEVFDRCKLDPGMFRFPADASVESCGLIFDVDGSGNIGGPAHPDSVGRPEFIFNSDCYWVGIGYSDKALEIVPLEDDGPCYKIVRTWCMIDWCELQNPEDDWVNNPQYADRVIKYKQYIKVFCECPCLINCSDLRDTAIACADIPQDLTDLYVHFNVPSIESSDTTQPCDGTLTSKTVIDTNQCGAGEIIRTWYLTDPLDHLVDSCNEVISLAPPEIMISQTKLYKGDAEPFNCSDSIITAPIVIDVDNCALLGDIVISNDSPHAVNDSNDASGTYPVGNYLVTYTITSNCFATFQVVDTIQVIDDVNPTVVAFSDPCVTKVEWLNDFQNNPLNPNIRIMLAVQGFDNCGVDTVLLVDLDSMFFPNQVIRDSIRYIYDWQALDIYGNLSDIKTTSILVSDLCNTSADIQGFVYTENQQPVSNVLIKTMNDEGIQVDYVANPDGKYSIEHTAESGIVITPFKDSDPKNGLSTADIIYISDHILGTRPIQNKYRMIAADVNDDGKSNPIDLMQLRKLILSKTDRFPNSNSWRFINAIDDRSNYHFLPADEDLILNFTGVKIGDVDQSSDPARSGGRSHSEVVLTTKDLHFSSGQKQAVEFSSDDLDKIRGFQFTIDFDPNILTLVALDGNEEIGLGEEHFSWHQQEDGKMSVSWDKIPATDLLTDELFVLEFEALKDCRLSDVLTINSSAIQAEAYDQSLNIMNLALEFKHENTDDHRFHLRQNWPNPFQHSTSISFELPEGMDAGLRIFDLTGKVQKYVKGHFQRGVHEIKLDAADFTPGILYYQLEAGEFIKTRKMVLIE
ncbi:MAG: T9SS type A sorting domain-containing protein [Saprospiraceae bacterium]|nr:T9SS type A sorting domain-containing protein [Saprospiraceae bacterium]